MRIHTGRHWPATTFCFETDMPGIGECVPAPVCQAVGGNTLRSHGRSGCTCLRYDMRNDDAGVPPAFFDEVGSWRPPFSVTQLISALSPSPSAHVQTRGSVRRASGFVQIAITLTDPERGERKAHACAIAC